MVSRPKQAKGLAADTPFMSHGLYRLTAMENAGKIVKLNGAMATMVMLFHPLV